MDSTLLKDFNDRSKEVDTYFLIFDNKENIDLELNKTLRATGFLLLYNLIEATMRNAIEAIFTDITNKDISFNDLKYEIQLIIIDNVKKNKSSKNLLENLTDISLDIISASFSSDKLFSGNIDAKKIKRLAMLYGFSCTTDVQKTQNGNDLLRIKTNRNDLAHGFKSFEEVGRGTNTEELLEIKDRVINYLQRIVKNIEDYISKQEYLK
ncbi:MAG: MAE_28990/MAE_18760 family HEPN-like nuclease [Cyanobacteria bacterium P01_G01_bin.39]